MKIRGKEKTIYEPVWCCQTFKDLSERGVGTLHIGEDYIGFEIQYDNSEYPMNIPVQFCPFCGEKIEL